MTTIQAVNVPAFTSRPLKQENQYSGLKTGVVFAGAADASANGVKKSADNKFSDTKLMIGLGALCTAVLGGLLAHKSIKLNKLSGEIKNLEESITETVTNNNSLKEQLSGVEEKLVNAKKKLVNAQKEVEELNKSQRFIDDSWAKDCRESAHLAYALINEEGKLDLAKEILREVQFALGSHGYAITADKELIIKNPKLFRIEYESSIDHFEVVTPTLYRETSKKGEIGEVVEKGLVYVPRKYKDKLAKLSEEEQKAIIQDPKMWKF